MLLALVQVVLVLVEAKVLVLVLVVLLEAKGSACLMVFVLEAKGNAWVMVLQWASAAIHLHCVVPCCLVSLHIKLLVHA